LIRRLSATLAVLLATGLSAAAQDRIQGTTQGTAQDAIQGTIKIGLITPLTGPFTTVGQEMQAAARLYIQHNGDSVAGRKIELIVRDDGGVPDTSKRIAQELIVNDKVSFLAGMGLTPIAFAVGPLATQAKIPLINMGAATSTIPKASPFIVRTSFATSQSAAIAAEYFAKIGIKSVVTLVSDYAPGIEIETWFNKTFEAAGGKVVQAMRVPLANPDFAPYLQRVADAKPEALFIFVPSGQGAALMRQFVERGMDKSGIKLLGDGSVLDDQLLDKIGDTALGVISAYHYSDAHPSELNKKFTADFEKATGGMRANMMGVGAYDGMALIYNALKKTNGDTDGTRLIEAMKGATWESPRGPMTIDPATRDAVQNIYLRRTEKVGGRYQNTEFETYPMVKNPTN
jgi:branched-chain amino acid transport system substrate-binding protein